MNRTVFAHQRSTATASAPLVRAGLTKRLQRAALAHGRASDVPPVVHEALQSPGQPLDSATRDVMESRFGQDFSRVRVHTSETAAESARAVNALAYTVGQDVVFGRGHYAPDSAAGRKVLAHELSHDDSAGRGRCCRANEPRN